MEPAPRLPGKLFANAKPSLQEMPRKGAHQRLRLLRLTRSVAVHQAMSSELVSVWECRGVV